MLQQAWRNERTLNVLRAGVWSVMGLMSIAMDLHYLGQVAPSSAGSLVWGAICAALGLSWLRRRYAPLLPYLFVTFDLLIFAWSAKALYPLLLELDPAMAQGYSRVLGAGILLILATNVLRLSVGVALWSLLCGAGMYIAVRLEQSGFEPAMLAELATFVAMILLSLITMTRTRVVVERIKERDTLARFLPEPVVERAAGAGEIDLGGREIEATVLFADIRSFTSLSSERSPGEIVDMLNEYFAEMVDEIFRWRGVLDKFLGDGICAVFTTVVDDTEPARRALACGAGMLRRLRDLNERRASRGEPPLEVGIGLHTGVVLAGTIGSPQRMEYTHIGDVVNTASRVQDLTKRFKTPLIASATTLERAGGDEAIPSRDLGSVDIRGRQQPVRLYAPDPESAAAILEAAASPSREPASEAR